jgi:hypothetical protein
VLHQLLLVLLLVIVILVSEYFFIEKDILINEINYYFLDQKVEDAKKHGELFLHSIKTRKEYFVFR